MAVILLAIMDCFATNPGPIDDSVLYDQDKHVSSAIWEGQVKCFTGIKVLALFYSIGGKMGGSKGMINKSEWSGVRNTSILVGLISPRNILSPGFFF